MKIGLFDSGVGGLTCLRSLLKSYPQHDYVYLGDTARLPYGTKTQETIKNYALQNIQFLKNLKVDMVISACHSASSAILNFKIKDDFPIHEVITPACAQIQSSMDRVGLLATASTVRSEIYVHALKSQKPKCSVIQQECPLLAPLVETGWWDDPITESVLRRYLDPLQKSQIQALILGCTHYPVLAQTIGRLMGPEVSLIDPGEALTQSLQPELTGGTKGTGSVKAYLTDDSPGFLKLAERLLPPESKLNIERCHL